MHCAHARIKPHTHPLGHLEPSLRYSPPRSEDIQRALPSLTPVGAIRSAEPLETSSEFSPDYTLRPDRIPQQCSTPSSNCLLLRSLSHSLTCTYLSCQISVWSSFPQIQPCSHSVTPSHCASLFQVPVCFVFFPLTAGNKISSLSHVLFFPLHPLPLSFYDCIPVSELQNSPSLSLALTHSVSLSCSLGTSGVGGVVLVVVILYRAGLVSPSNPNNPLKCQSPGYRRNLKPTAKQASNLETLYCTAGWI